MKKRFIFITCILIVLQIFLSSFTLTAYAASAASQYSSPIEDLESVENFDAADYPDIATDYSLQVIALAESADGELYAYGQRFCFAMSRRATSTESPPSRLWIFCGRFPAIAWW